MHQEIKRQTRMEVLIIGQLPVATFCLFIITLRLPTQSLAHMHAKVAAGSHMH